MTLTEDVKQKIYEDYESCKDTMYGKLTDKERKALGAFYTPPALVIKMIEKFNDLEGDICDPCVGAGLLLSGAIIAGADPKRCYGIELDEGQAELCRNRLAQYGVPPENIITGDCLLNETWRKLPCYENRFRFGGVIG
jgi:type I restriction-modification system DNA methylase subunit